MKGGNKKINQVFLVGRLTKTPEIKIVQGKKQTQISLAVKRNFKNPDGIYETDFINCIVWNVIAERVCEYCKKGSIISVKARVQNNNYINKDDKKVYAYEFIAESISFMQSSNNIKNKEEIENPEDLEAPCE